MAFSPPSPDTLVEETFTPPPPDSLVEEPASDPRIPEWLKPRGVPAGSSLSGVPSPQAGLPLEPADTAAGLQTKHFEGTAPPEIREAKKPTTEQAMRGVGQPLLSKAAEKSYYIKSQFGKQDMPDDEFVKEHPNFKYAIYGFMGPTDMPAPRLTTQEGENLFGKAAGGIAAGAQNAVADFVDFATSAPGVMTALTGGVAGGAELAGAKGISSAIHRGTTYTFAADMAQHMPEQFGQVVNAIERGDKAEATRGILGAIASMAVIGSAAKAKTGQQPYAFAKELGLEFKENGLPGMSVEGMDPAMLKELRKKYPVQWEFTDRRPGSPTEGMSFYTDEGASRGDIQNRMKEKSAGWGKPSVAPPIEPPAVPPVIETTLPNAPEIPAKTEEVRPADPLPVATEERIQQTGGDPSVAQGEAKSQLPVTPPLKLSEIKKKWTTATEPTFGSEAGFVDLTPLKELWERAMPAVKASVEALKAATKENMTLAKTSDYRRSILHWSGKLQKSFSEAAEAQKEIQSAVKDPIRREALTNWIQAGGDTAVLQQRLAATLAWKDPTTGKPHPQQKQLAAGYQAALNLTPAEIAIAGDAKTAYDTLGLRGQTYDVLKNFKDNYVTQIWNLSRSPTGGASGRTLKDKFRFSKASTFPTFFDGEQAGFVPKTKDISKLLPVYLHEMNSVIAARQLVEQMSKGKASDGRPLLAARGRGVAIDDPTGKATLVLPDAMAKESSDYKTLEGQPALHDWRWEAKDSAGNPVFMKADLSIHPEAYDNLKSVLGQSAIKEWYNSRTSAAAALPKALAKGLDIFQSETKRTMLGLLTPFHQVQEGTHAIGHRVNPFWNNPEIDLVKNPAQAEAAKHGLMLLPDRASESQFMEGFRHSGIVSRVPGLGPLADHYSHYLFHQYIPGIKFKTYEAIVERNKKVYAKELSSGKATLEDVKILSAEQANAAYGHLNYADLARNPTMLHLMRLGLLAPDFLEARFRFAGQAIKGVGGAKIGREQLIALATLAVAQATLSWTAAQLTGGQWDAKDPFAFHLGNRKFTMRSVPEDAVRLATDTRAFVYARLNPILGRGAVQYLSGVDWRGQKVTPAQTAKEIAQQPVPLALRPLFNTDNSPLTGWEQLAGAAGLKISRYSAQSEIRKVAHKWMDNHPDPKIKAAEERYQKGTLPDSDYKPLREALINNDFETARKAYEELRKTRKPEIITRTFANPRPFSGSNERESKFKKSLTPEQRVLYDQAIREQKDLNSKFRKMRSQKTKKVDTAPTAP